MSLSREPSPRPGAATTATAAVGGGAGTGGRGGGQEVAGTTPRTATMFACVTTLSNTLLGVSVVGVAGGFSRAGYTVRVQCGGWGSGRWGWGEREGGGCERRYVLEGVCERGVFCLFAQGWRLLFVLVCWVSSRFCPLEPGIHSPPIVDSPFWVSHRPTKPIICMI